MNELDSLARALLALDDKLAACMRCGLCQAVCPVFGETMREADVSRGKIALLENLSRKLIEDPDAVEARLNRCLLCGACRDNCPSGVPTLDIFLEARSILAAWRGLSPLKKLIFRTLLPRPKLFDAATRLGVPFQGLVLRDCGNAQQTCSMPLLSCLLGDRRVNRLPSRSLHQTCGEVRTEPGKSRRKILFYPGCLCDRLYPRAGQACLKALAHHEVGVRMPAGLVCCGLPALASGDRKGFVRQVLANVAVLRNAFSRTDIERVVTPCPSCTATIREWWPRHASLLPFEAREFIAEIAPKVMDIHQFLVDELGAGRKPPAWISDSAALLTYHDSCHLKKSLGVTAQPRALLQMNTSYRFVEMEEADRCCGCGGSFTLTHYELSGRIGERKRGHVAASGASVVATGCPACMMQLSDLLSKHGDPVQVRHSMEIYAESLK